MEMPQVFKPVPPICGIDRKILAIKTNIGSIRNLFLIPWFLGLFVVLFYIWLRTKLSRNAMRGGIHLPPGDWFYFSFTNPGDRFIITENRESKSVSRIANRQRFVKL